MSGHLDDESWEAGGSLWQVGVVGEAARGEPRQERQGLEVVKAKLVKIRVDSGLREHSAGVIAVNARRVIILDK